MPGAKPVFYFGVGGLVFVPILEAITGGFLHLWELFWPFSVLWLITDIMHFPFKEHEALRVPHVLTRVDTSGVLFFLGYFVCVDALQAAGFLQVLADWMDVVFKSQSVIANFYRFFSAVIDNVPLVAATMGMYPLGICPVKMPSLAHDSLCSRYRRQHADHRVCCGEWL